MSSKCALHFDDQVELGNTLKRMAQPGDVILFKGSRGMRMERVLEQFLAEGEKK